MSKLDVLRESAGLIFTEFADLHFNGIDVSFEGKKVDLIFTKKMRVGWFWFITTDDGTTEIDLCVDRCDSEEKLKNLINSWRVM